MAGLPAGQGGDGRSDHARPEQGRSEHGRPGKARLAIIAGSGQLPLHVAEAARRAGEDPLIVTLKNESDRNFAGFDQVAAGVGDLATIEKSFRDLGIGRVIMSGGVSRRPEWREIHPTWRTIRKMPSVVRTLLAGGDDAVLQMVIRLIEAMGCDVLGVHQIAPDLLATTGPLGQVTPSDDDRRDIDKAGNAARLLGELDVGQGAVSVGGRIVALEGVEGTDAMLQRVAALRAAGRVSARRKGVLVKLCKPQQDIRADLPTIGPSTVRNAVAAGLAGIAVEAGRALVLDRDEMIELANASGIFVCGIDAGLPGQGLS